MRGRPPLPDHVKKKRGTFKKSRSNPDAPNFKPLKRVPSPKIELSDTALRVYNKVCKELISQSLISDIDIDLIMLLALEYDELYFNFDRIKNGGRIDENMNSGRESPSAYVTMKNKNIDNISSLCKMLYITPPLRQKLKLGLKLENEATDPTEILIS